MNPHRALAAESDLPLFDVAATRRIEQRALASLAPGTLMQRAGLALAQLALAIAPHARRIVVAAGPGNNGGDGLEAAARLRGWGKEVQVWLAAAAADLTGDAAMAHHRAIAAGVPIAQGAIPSDLAVDRDDLAIDALLGIGANRSPEGAVAAAITALNQLACPVLAVDVPSGLNPDTGQPLGTGCVVAQHTLTMLSLKPGLFTASGRDHAGDVWLAALDVSAPAEEASAWLVGPRAGQPQRRHAAHKGTFGDVAVIGSARGMAGAALLAARAAHAAGAGRVLLQCLDAATATLDGVRPELMLRPRWLEESSPQALAASTVVCGCGGGVAVRDVLPRVLSRAGRLVLDADALNAVSGDPMLQALLQGRAGAGLRTVLTPHPLEAARLLGCDRQAVQSDRLGTVQRLARQFQCVVALKGSGTVIVRPDSLPFVNPTGNASLASAGTGDVLAGWLGGVWSQASDASTVEGAFNAAIRSVWQHGRAADLAERHVMRAGDLIEALAALPSR